MLFVLCLAFRYWLHLVDLSVWINRQNSQLHKCLTLHTQTTTPSSSPALFGMEQVGQLLRLLLLSQLTYVPNPLNGRGLRTQRGRGGGVDGEGADEFGGGCPLSVFLLINMSVSVICFSSYEPLCSNILSPPLFVQ